MKEWYQAKHDILREFEEFFGSIPASLLPQTLVFASVHRALLLAAYPSFGGLRIRLASACTRSRRRHGLGCRSTRTARKWVRAPTLWLQLVRNVFIVMLLQRPSA